jgi:hypothetical protein
MAQLHKAITPLDRGMIPTVTSQTGIDNSNTWLALSGQTPHLQQQQQQQQQHQARRSDEHSRKKHYLT